MIDKITAGILYSYGYKLQDSEGNVLHIKEIRENQRLYISTTLDKDTKGFSKVIGFEEIGTTYKILARPLEMLTKEIEGKVPIHEMFKMAINVPDAEMGGAEYNTELKQLEVKGSKGLKLAFAFDPKDNSFVIVGGEKSYTVANQLSLFQYLYSLNFNIGFPENTTTDL